MENKKHDTIIKMEILSFLAGVAYDVDETLLQMCIAPAFIFAIFAVIFFLADLKPVHKARLLILCGIILSALMLYFINFSLDPEF